MTCTMRRLSARTRGNLGRDIDVKVIPPSSAYKGVPCPVHKHCNVGRLGANGQRASLDARHIQKVADEFSHAVRLINYDSKELSELSRVEF